MSSLDGIDVFVKVVQAGSFTGAARLLQMPVTTVSGKVASLEMRLGVTLLHRTTRKLSITEAGEAYFQHCVRALEEMNAGEAALQTSKVEPEGLLRITAPPDIGHLLLPDIVRQYLKTYPKTQIDLILTNNRVDLVGEGVDLAIRAGALPDSSLITKKFMDLELSLFASKSYSKINGLPKVPKDLTKYQVILFKGFQPRKMSLVNGRSRYKPEFSSRLQVDDIESVKVFIMGGDGIGLLPPIICQTELASGTLIPVLSGWKVEFEYGTQGQLSFVYPPQRFVSPKTRAFIEMASHYCSQKL